MSLNVLPLVSVVVVNYNGKGFLLDCLGSVLKSDYANIEVIVVDNGSTDGSVQAAGEMFNDSRVRIINLEYNFGPAYARNRGIENSGGAYIAFLDNDTMPSPKWLNKPIEAMELDLRIGFCQCKLMLKSAPDKFDYAGDYLGQFGFLVQRARAGEEDKGQYDQSEDIFSAKSAGMVGRTTIIKRLKGFDEDYFIYMEETDLCWRGWLMAKKTVFIPESVVYHAFGGSALSLGSEKQNYFAKFHGCKNYITTLIKNLGMFYLLIMVPVHILMWLAISIWLIFHLRLKDSWHVFRGILWVFLHFPGIAKKRKEAQSKRVISDRELFKIIMKKRSLFYFYKKLSGHGSLGQAQSFYRRNN